MSNLLKDIYNNLFFDDFSDCLKEVIPYFDKKTFLSSIFIESWHELELKQRMYHIAYVLSKYLPEDFQKSANYIEHLIKILNQRGYEEKSVEFMFIPSFIEVYGIKDYKTSIRLIEIVTQFTSCEFAVRPFIIKYPDEMIKQMYAWSQHKSHKVRRLSSEGCRPRLPWAITIPFLKKDPVPILLILEKLKNDNSQYVRRSVANNLNDISKDHPEIVIQIAKKWKGTSKEIDSLIKHACRTLLKQGNQELMELFGFGKINKIKLSNFKINTPNVKIGEYLDFSFDLTNSSNSTFKTRMEYGLYYRKHNGQQSKKVFKISEREISPKTTISIKRKQSFEVLTTRRFYVGKHMLSIIINGIELDQQDFQLLNP